MGVIAGLVTFVILESLVLWQYPLADGLMMNTVKQMQKIGVKGLPLEYHFGITGDKYYLSLLIAVVVYWFWPQWQWYDILKVTVWSIIIALALGALWCMPNTPEAHMLNHRPTEVGLVHGVYMVPVIAVLLLAFFYTPQPNIVLLVIVAVVFVLHLFVGQHMLLGVLKAMHPEEYRWYPDEPLKNWLGWAFLIAISVAFYWRIRVLAG